MVDKRKNIKRKLRRLRAIKRSELRQASAATTSKTDTLLSSMEALIRKMSMTPSTPTSTIISPSPSAPIVKSEHTKEEILNDIAKQRELDMVRSQVQYMYDQMNDDIRARRNKGEVMAKMQAHNTNVKPSAFDIDENDEIYKVQKDAAKSKQQLLKLSQHDLLDEQEIARKERTALHQHLSDNLVTKIANVANTFITPKKQSSPSLELNSPVDMSGLTSESSPNDSNNDAYEIEKREAQEFVEQSFEQVSDAAAKLNVKATLDDFAQRQYDDKRNTMIQLLTNLRSVNDQIIDRMNEVIASYKSLSPERKLESALQAQAKRTYLQKRNNDILGAITNGKTKLSNAEYHAKRIADPDLRNKELDKIKANREKLTLLQQEYNDNKNTIDNSSELMIESLKNERKDKMIMLQDEINNALDDDQELKKLILERDKLQCMINSDNRKSQTIYMPTDPNGAKEALDNQRKYVERYVEDLNKNGENTDD